MAPRIEALPESRNSLRREPIGQKGQARTLKTVSLPPTIRPSASRAVATHEEASSTEAAPARVLQTEVVTRPRVRIESTRLEDGGANAGGSESTDSSETTDGLTGALELVGFCATLTALLLAAVWL